MSQVENNEFELDDLTSDTELPQETGTKDSRNKQKYEARKRIDELLEEKRLRKLLDDDWDLDESEED
ncbi:hypothetical protein QE250_01285 [Chromatiaceae bacterium AAb-1]|nr:hypothetical protein [Chromatiaceae bacterium AAb-1]